MSSDVVPFSERIRDAREQGDPPTSAGLVSYWHRQVDHHEPTRIGAVILQAHLTIGTPETFFSPELDASVVDVDAFLSDNEQDDLLGQAGDQANSDTLAELRHPDATVLAIGQPPQSDDTELDWVIGLLGYREPSDRLIGPQHQQKSVSDFGQEFINRGGSFLVFDPNTSPALADQCALATKFVSSSTENA